MAKLIYRVITSLDGYVADAQGNFDWAVPDDEVHAFVNDLERTVGTYLCGRRLYEVMKAWEDLPDLPGQPPVIQDYADIWKRADKVVFSSTLGTVDTARTRLSPSFDPDAIRDVKAAATRDVTIGGAHLAAQAIRAGLVDEYGQFLSPIVVGGGTRFLPDDVRVELELLDERRFRNGVVYLRYGTRAH